MKIWKIVFAIFKKVMEDVSSDARLFCKKKRSKQNVWEHCGEKNTKVMFYKLLRLFCKSGRFSKPLGSPFLIC